MLKELKYLIAHCFLYDVVLLIFFPLKVNFQPVATAKRAVPFYMKKMCLHKCRYHSRHLRAVI